MPWPQLRCARIPRTAPASLLFVVPCERLSRVSSVRRASRALLQVDDTTASSTGGTDPRRHQRGRYFGHVSPRAELLLEQDRGGVRHPTGRRRGRIPIDRCYRAPPSSVVAGIVVPLHPKID